MNRHHKSRMPNEKSARSSGSGSVSNGSSSSNCSNGSCSSSDSSRSVVVAATATATQKAKRQESCKMPGSTFVKAYVYKYKFIYTKHLHTDVRNIYISSTMCVCYALTKVRTVVVTM